MKRRSVIFSPEAQGDLEWIYDAVATASSPTIAPGSWSALKGIAAVEASVPNAAHAETKFGRDYAWWGSNAAFQSLLALKRRRF